MNGLRENERAWAIDLVSYINEYVKNKTRPVVRARGEASLDGVNGGPVLFPDIVLLGDESGSRVRHGWELKFPDTPLSDPEFYNNAVEKARRMKVNSFVLWNVSEAALYAQAGDESDFVLEKKWPPILGATRKNIKELEPQWLGLLHTIIDDVNEFFEAGKLKSASPERIFDERFFADYLNNYWGVTARSIKSGIQKSGQLDAEVSEWWQNSASEFEKTNKDPADYKILAFICLANWMNRIIFCHYLKKHHSAAKEVETLHAGMSLMSAENVFRNITSICDFKQIFQSVVASHEIGVEAWTALCEINRFLTDVEIENIPEASLQRVMEGVIESTKRKTAGQYATPTQLAKLLVGLAVEDRTGHIWDPCCGTGTIARAFYDLKRKKGQTEAQALATGWASDKFQFPLQLCALSLADPAGMGEILRVFKQDVFGVWVGQEISFLHPKQGITPQEKFPEMSSIISNLPFVRFETSKKHNDTGLAKVRSMPDAKAMSSKADLWAYIVFYLHGLLKNQGRLGIIVSNSWLSADWGNEFRKGLLEKFHVRAVVTSGAGRWFENAAVVTNLLILEKKNSASVEDPTKFVTTLTPLGPWDEQEISSASSKIITSAASVVTPRVRINLYSYEDRRIIENICVGWSCFFADVHWLKPFVQVLIKASSLLVIGRGERRGWDPLFYPANGHQIEAEYIKPVLKNTKEIEGYVATPDADAFCCSVDENTLEARNHRGALGWIAKFKRAVNGDGKPLTEVLARSSLRWYEMKADVVADLVMGMNPEDRLFLSCLAEPGFVNQRLISFRKKGDVHLEVIHALLNSTLSLFMIETAGFGRGQGALDLQASKLREGFYMLNPELLSPQSLQDIVSSFAVVKDRAVLPLEDELRQPDREHFDLQVLRGYGMEHALPAIRASLLDIYRIRKSVK